MKWKCSECPKKIPPARRKITNNKTCSEACSAIRTRRGTINRVRSYRKRVRRTLENIPHESLVPDTEPVVRYGHVVALKEGDTWKLVLVLRATREGTATHACPPFRWEGEKPGAAKNRLKEGTRVAVLPPEWAENQTLALSAEEAGVEFRDLEDLSTSLAAASEEGNK